MNMFTRKWVISAALIALSLPALAQQKPQVITVPISNPGEPVILEIGIMSARIEVIGENRDDAAYEAHTRTAHFRDSRPLVEPLILEQEVFESDALALNPLR